MAEYLPLLNMLLVPICIWVIRVERRLTKVETILEIKNKKGGGK